jgi:hypothetical protein
MSGFKKVHHCSDVFKKGYNTDIIRTFQYMSEYYRFSVWEGDTSPIPPVPQWASEASP